ncbi:DUF6701 domain-containing protein [Echinimonas agarilytica]|uniref:DUF6701 domain-containing protein n=1 Tax=Echinimonas agarilytica TaxID=1215918 RepID=A0AA42B6C2_9GAMM|nr:DUF6701 domain-containing protein [Echinimonas agarilytica]MCM2678592.1 hypothetical protein [Echinimonas agarilytica]
MNIRFVFYLLCGLLFFALSTKANAVACEDVLSKTLQGLRTGAFLQFRNGTKVINTPAGEQFDFEILYDLTSGSSCPGAFPDGQCQISNQLGIRPNGIPLRDVASGGRTIIVNTGETVILGQNGESRFNQIIMNGGDLYFWGGAGANLNAKGYVEYEIRELIVQSGDSTVFFPPGDIWIGQTFNIVSGEIITEGLSTAGVDPSNPLKSQTTRFYSNAQIVLQSNATGINKDTSYPVENLVIYTDKRVQIFNGHIRGALVQDARDANYETLELQNSTAKFEGLAVVETSVDTFNGEIIHNSDVLNADFSDICDSNTVTDIEVVPAAPKALTCEAVDVTIRMLNAGNLISDYEGTIELSSSTNKGNWQSQASNQGSLTGTGGDNGSAFYAFDSDDGGTVTLSFRHPEVGPVTLYASDGSVTGTGSDVEFVPEGFTVDFLAENPIANTVFSAIITAVESSDDPAVCVPDDSYTGTKSIDFSVEYEDIHPGIPATQVRSLKNDVDTVPEYGSGALTKIVEFNAGVSEQVRQFKYKDVGGLTLHASEADSNDPSTPLVEGQGTVVVVPAGIRLLKVANDDCSLLNPEGTALTGNGFVAAGQEFELSIAGIMQHCEPSDDCSLISDPCITPNFSEDISFSPSLDTPSGGQLGTFQVDGNAGMAVVPADFSDGFATLSKVTYSEVGSVTLEAELADFLGTGTGAQVHAQTIGRFYPAYFELESSSAMASCVLGDFSYLGHTAQQLDYEVLARNANDGTVRNYDTDSLGYQFAAQTPSYWLFNRAVTDVDLSGRLNGLGSTLKWVNGVVILSDNFGVERQGVNAAIDNGPFTTAELGLSLKGGDDETFEASELTYPCTGSCDAIQLLPDVSNSSLGVPLAPMYFGRLVVGNGYGADTETVHVRNEFERYESSGFVFNGKDSCSALTLNMMSFTPDNSASGIPIGSGKSEVSMTSNLSTYGDAVVANEGRYWVRYSAPDSRGYATHYMGVGGVSAPSENWPEWLKDDWGNTGVLDEAVSGVAVFGRQRSSDRVITRREVMP